MLGGGDGEKGAQVKDKLLRVAQLKSQFVELSALWAGSLPAEFMEMEMRFALDNRERLGSFRVLNEMADARYLVRRLGEAAHTISAGKPVSFGGISLPLSRKGERALLLSRYEAFEERIQRAYAAAETHKEDDGHPRGVDDLVLAQGLERLREGVVLYFQTQKELLESELSTKLHSAAGSQVGFVRLEGLPNVPLCTVCQDLLHKPQVMWKELPTWQRHTTPHNSAPTPHPAPRPVPQQQQPAPPSWGTASAPSAARHNGLSAIRAAFSSLESSRRFRYALIAAGLAELAIIALVLVH
jgi:hypothetical protein